MFGIIRFSSSAIIVHQLNDFKESNKHWRLTKAFCLGLYYVPFFSMYSNLLFVELESEKTGQNIEAVIGPVGAGVLLLVIVVIISFIIR